MAAVLLAAMMVFASCSQPTDGDPGSPGSPGNPGPAVAPESVSAQVLQALLVNSSTVYLDGNTTITSATGDTVTIPAGKTLKVIDGNLTLAATAGALVFDASSGTLDLSDIGSGKIQGTASGGTEVFIGLPALTSNASLIDSANLTAVPLVTALPEGTTGAIAVRNFNGELGDAAFDYAEYYTVYVLDDITEPVGTDSDEVDLSGHKITFLGTVNVYGTGNLKLGTTSLINVLNILPGGDLTIVDGDEYAGTITNSGAATLTLTNPGDPAIKVGASDLTIGGAPATLALGSLDTTAGGALVLPASAISFTATLGGGKIKYAAAPASIAVSSENGLTFVEDTTTAGAFVSTAGDVTVAGDLSTAALTAGADLTVNGDLAATGAAAFIANLSVTGAASFGGNASVTGTAAFSSTVTSTAAAAATFTFGGATTVTGALTVGTGGLTIAGIGAVTLAAKPVVDTGKLLTVTNSGGVTLAGGIDVAVAGGLTISGSGKAVLADGKIITITSSGTVTAGYWSLGTAGTATATKAITLNATGITGADPSAKLALAASKITVGLTDTNGIGAAFDSVDVYLASGTASVVVQSGATGTNATTLTLSTGAKISGLTGAAALAEGTTVTALPGTSASATAPTDIIATTGTPNDPATGNFLGIASGKTTGRIVATASSGAKDVTIVITTKATATGA
jgi:hypothetical protein